MSSCLHWIIFPHFIFFLERHLFPSPCFITKERWTSREICNQGFHSCSLEQGNHTNDSLLCPLLQQDKSAFPLPLLQGQWSSLELPEQTEQALIITDCKGKKKTCFGRAQGGWRSQQWLGIGGIAISWRKWGKRAASGFQGAALFRGSPSL